MPIRNQSSEFKPNCSIVDSIHLIPRRRMEKQREEDCSIVDSIHLIPRIMEYQREEDWLIVDSIHRRMEYQREEDSKSENWKREREKREDMVKAMKRECMLKVQRRLEDTVNALREQKDRGWARQRARFEDLERLRTKYPSLRSIELKKKKKKKKKREEYTGINPLRGPSAWMDGVLSPRLLRAMERAWYSPPSVIPMADIPLMFQRHDVIGFEDTGTPGKAYAFILPMLDYITRLPSSITTTDENEANGGPYAVVMSPTTELAQQIESETLKLSRYLGIKVVCLVATPNSIDKEEEKEVQGCEVVITTPACLLDCLEARSCAFLNRCNYVALDEADSMINMGFEPQLVSVLDAMPLSNMKPENDNEELDQKRIYPTTHMFIATMSPAVEQLARKYLRNPVFFNVASLTGNAAELIKQDVMLIKETDKMERLIRLLDELGDKKAVVFVNTEEVADNVTKMLDKEGYRVAAFHGGKVWHRREISLHGFRTERYNVLVATDDIGRLGYYDLPDVAHVINYDMPREIETYTHRIVGRTGHEGKTNVSTTFLTTLDIVVFRDLKHLLIRSNNHVPLELMI